LKECATGYCIARHVGKWAFLAKCDYRLHDRHSAAGLRNGLPFCADPKDELDGVEAEEEDVVELLSS